MAAPKDKWPLLKAQYLEHMKVRNYSRRTAEGHERHLRYFFQYLEKETKVQDLSQLTHGDMVAFQTWLSMEPSQTKDAPIGARAQGSRLGALKVFFRYLFKRGVLLSDPTASLELPRYHRYLPHGILSPKQVLALLKAPDVKTLRGIRDRAILELLYATGMRSEELRTLRFAQLDLPGRQILVDGKGGKQRLVPLGRIALGWLVRYIEEVRPVFAATRDPGNVFLSRAGYFLKRAELWKVVSRNAVRAGLPAHTGPHALRHTCATHLLQRGADIRFIQELLGHESLSTTQIYTRVDITDLKKVHAAFHPRENA